MAVRGGFTAGISLFMGLYEDIDTVTRDRSSCSAFVSGHLCHQGRSLRKVDV